MTPREEALCAIKEAEQAAKCIKYELTLEAFERIHEAIDKTNQAVRRSLEFTDAIELG
jgi:vacuolar-type H+-ATPase subunit H